MWKPKGDVMKSMVVLEALQNVKARNKVLQTPSSTIYNQTLVQSDARGNDMLLLLMHGGDDRIMSYCNARLARLARLWLVYPHAQQQSRRTEERTRLRYVIHHETTIAKALLSDVLQLSHAEADVRMVRCSGSFEGDQRIEVACVFFHGYDV